MTDARADNDPVSDAAGARHPVTQRHHGGISVVLRIDVGMSVLQIGASDGRMAEALASAGARLTVLETDTTGARDVAAKLVAEASAQVVGSSLVEWTASSAATPETVDLIVYLEAPRASAVTATADDVLDRVDLLLAHSGALVMAIRNRWGLSGMLRGAAEPEGRSPAALARALRERGLNRQRWLVPYPDHVRPQVIVDGPLFDDANGRTIIRSAVREPVAADGGPFLIAPRDAFRVALESGLAPAVADSVVVLAARSQGALDDISRAGSLWMVPSADLAPAWQRPRELVDMNGRRVWHAVDTYRTVTSGPLILEPATVPVRIGDNGEDLVVDVLTGSGAFSEAGRDVLSAWWQAVRAVLATSEPGRWPLDLRPRQFIVSEDGRWHHDPQDVARRFALPAELLALGALIDTIADAALDHGPIVGLPPQWTVAQAARALLTDIGLACDEAIEFLWLETTADVLVRTSRNIEREDARGLLQRRAGTRLDSRMSSMPVSELLRAGSRLPEMGARVATLEAELARIKGEPEAAEAATPPPQADR